MTTTNQTLTLRPFEVHIPNLEGDEVAETVTIQVHVYIDPVSGEEVLTPDSLALIEKTKARRMGLMLPDEIRELRERLDLTQEAMSDLLQIGAKSYTRWESGRARPSRSLNVLLCALRDGVMSVDYLRALREERDWAPMLNRRLENSIILWNRHARAATCSIYWQQVYSAHNSPQDAATKFQAELCLSGGSISAGRMFGDFRVGDPTFDCTESAKAA